jgi:succinate dehydrogenase flavin-adding protein (antitoxin of CptAB toxin-antitoxin module)
MEDHDLWELVSGRAGTDDPQLQGMVETLRRQGVAGSPESCRLD